MALPHRAADQFPKLAMHLRRFGDDTNGLVAVMFILFSSVLFGVAALAVDLSQLVTAESSIDRIVRQTCDRIVTVDDDDDTDLATREDMAGRYLRRAILTDQMAGRIKDTDLSVIKNGEDYRIKLEATVSTTFARTFGVDSMNAGVDMDCDATPQYAEATNTYNQFAYDDNGNVVRLPDGNRVIFEETFDSYMANEYEDMIFIRPSQWDESTGEIEIHNRRWPEMGDRIYAELDAHYNVSISKRLQLLPGRFRLSFSHRSRPAWSQPELGNPATDNAIHVAFNSVNEPRQIVHTDAIGSSSWQTHTVILEVERAGEYLLGFHPAGPSDSFGGLIDDIKLEVI